MTPSFIDTHAHVWWPSLAQNLPGVLERAREAGVAKIIMPGTNLETSRAAMGIARQYPGFLYAAVGIHPEDIDLTSQHPNGITSQRDNILTNEQSNRSTALENLPFRIQNLEKLISEDQNAVVAIGEIGTDATVTTSQHPNEPTTKHRQHEAEIQRAYFRAQCELALEFDLPIIIHTRESLSETLAVLDTLPQMPRGQFHCFSYDEEGLGEVLKRGFFVSLCGNVSWSKRIRKLSAEIPLARLLLETDSPFMTPLEKKPAENEPAHVTITAQILADERGLSLPELAEATSANAQQLFRL